MIYPLLILLATFGRFLGAGDLDYDIEGNIYVVDRAGNALMKYSPQGDSLRAVSGLGNGSLQFDRPVAVHARRGNDVFVADYNNHRVERFDRNLDYVTTIYTRDDPDSRNRFGYPRDVSMTRQGEILIVDGENRRIIRFDSFGKVESTFGDVNAGAGRLIEPSAVEVDGNDNAYVLDGNRILMFDPFGGYVRDVVLPGTDPIRSIAIDRDTLIASDSATVTLYDLHTRSVAGTYALASPASAIHLLNGWLLTAEKHRVAVYRIDSVATAGNDE